ncbi:MAG: hypothetical protein IH851_06185 [Armatimonadetes bacterium]|nr:hypothetical protein [Armatimonadota bacterium]
MIHLKFNHKFLIGVGLSVQALAASPLMGGTIRVPEDYPAIQLAINVAVEGDHIVVNDGVWSGPLNVDLDTGGLNLTIRSLNGPENCIIDCGGTRVSPHRAFYVRADQGGHNCIIVGFTIINGYVTAGSPGGARGGGILELGGGAGVMNCRFINCRSESLGGALYTDRDEPVSNCTFEGNDAALFGGAVYVSNTSVSITDCTFRGNSAGMGGAIYSDTAESIIIRGCTFDGNSAVSGSGGGVGIQGGLADVSGCTFIGNWATGFGGALHSDSSLRMDMSVVMSNAAGTSGGGLSLQSGDFVLVNSLFAGNVAGGEGGGVAAYGALTATNCTFSGNTAATFGGAVMSRRTTGAAPSVIQNSVLWGNSAPEGSEVGLADYVGTSGSLIVRYSDVRGGEAGVYVGTGSFLTWGSGNIDSDPQYLDPAGSDYHFRPGSAIADAGDNASVPPGTVTDLDGGPRFDYDPSAPGTGRGKPPIVDMGAYEVHPGVVEQFTVLRGMRLAGDLTSLLRSDNDYLGLRPWFVLTTDEPPVQVVVEGVVSDAPMGRLLFILEASVSGPNLRQTIELFDFDAGGWVVMNVSPATLFDSTVVVSVEENAERFVENGTNRVRAKLVWQAAGPLLFYPWIVRIDQAAWSVMP